MKMLIALLVLGVIIYLIILLDDLDYGMGLVNEVIEGEIRSRYL